MATFYVIIATIAWLISGLIAQGFYRGSYYHKRYGYLPFTNTLIEDLCFGPISILATVMVYGSKHWTLCAITREQRWEIYKREFPIYSQLKKFEDFE